MNPLHLAVGALACSAKLMALAPLACTIDSQPCAAGMHRVGKQLHGRGLWDSVPPPSPARFVMGAASEVATAAQG